MSLMPHSFSLTTKKSSASVTNIMTVTKKDLQIELAPINADLNLLKWMIGALIAMTIANFAKQYF